MKDHPIYVSEHMLLGFDVLQKIQLTEEVKDKDMSLNLRISLFLFSGDCEQLSHGDMVEPIIYRWLHPLGHLFS